MKIFLILIITIIISSCSLIKDENVSQINLLREEGGEVLLKEIEKELKLILKGQKNESTIYTNTGIINPGSQLDYTYNDYPFIELQYTNRMPKIILLKDNKNKKLLENFISLGDYNSIYFAQYENTNYIEYIGEKIPNNFNKLSIRLGKKIFLEKLFISLLDKNINNLSIDMLCGGKTPPIFSKKVTDKILKKDTKFELELMCGGFLSFEDNNFLEKAKNKNNLKIILK